ncbi:hypothetical protein MSAN_02498000 [Mycena sanguinolenta]|uniref:Macrofage activating glycoprotein n=1 Tax=Mycena sanguinolenta TaxID=230812 RepID=A0A8H6U3C4_9AGAR|nr:hypothetical protein MSAN_02498000 [Mycena sanguinolenta]
MTGPTLLSFALLATCTVVRAYFSPDPLVDKVIPYGSIPYQVMNASDDDPRGFQTGYNICNTTTETQDSQCQTMFVNHVDGECAVQRPLLQPFRCSRRTPFLSQTSVSGHLQPPTRRKIADSEGIEVAWCSKKGHGTRIIPEGTITSLQMVKTPSYIQIAGTLNQNFINIGGTDGGELDSGGQDGEGNPMGGLVYTNAFSASNGNNGTYIQAQHWSFFIGDSAFCGKICDQTGPNPGGLCNNVYDRLGCEYNAPSDVDANTFEYCLGDDMMPVGTYVGQDGKTSVYTQPAETDSIDYDNLPSPPPPSSRTASASPLLLGMEVMTNTSVPTTGSNTGSGTAATTTVDETPRVSGGTTDSGKGSGAVPSATGKSGAVALGVSAGAVAAAFFAVLPL